MRARLRSTALAAMIAALQRGGKPNADAPASSSEPIGSVSFGAHAAKPHAAFCLKNPRFLADLRSKLGGAGLWLCRHAVAAMIAALFALSACRVSPPELTPAPTAAFPATPSPTAAPTPTPAPDPSALAEALVKMYAEGKLDEGPRDMLLALPDGRERLERAVLAEGERRRGALTERPLDELRSLPLDWAGARAFYQGAVIAGLCADEAVADAVAALSVDESRQNLLFRVGERLTEGDVDGAAENAAKLAGAYASAWSDSALRAWADELLGAADAAPDRASAMHAAMAAQALAAGQVLSRAQPHLTPKRAWRESFDPALYKTDVRWALYEFDPVDYPLRYVRGGPLKSDAKERVERIIRQWQALYPPDFFNARVTTVLALDWLDAVRYDDSGKPVAKENGELVFDPVVGAMSGGVIIITDNFKSDEDILRALVHEMAHIETEGGVSGYPSAFERFETRGLREKLATLNGAFTYWYNRPGVTSTADIPGWRSTDGPSDYREGWARRYGSLSFAEDAATLTEKLLLKGKEAYREYPALFDKLCAVESFRARLHPDL